MTPLFENTFHGEEGGKFKFSWTIAPSTVIAGGLGTIITLLKAESDGPTFRPEYLEGVFLLLLFTFIPLIGFLYTMYLQQKQQSSMSIPGEVLECFFSGGFILLHHQTVKRHSLVLKAKNSSSIGL